MFKRQKNKTKKRQKDKRQKHQMILSRLKLVSVISSEQKKVSVMSKKFHKNY